ncbi:hypothetical protein EV363DRAFT_1173601 [Boletus edulis]|uniref:Uncharacterized protein n=1 Tax=Boletus edulis BED1 TaxID=1328754 RepID=A0AAD4BEB0_BOLED|nr:hypothetical protein EV363DRAFT_1173601 [Boletus edulis]KAF8422316.1 hypothetical protein L210DRAFT_575586 [Boletus edulis BED1]
MHSIMHSQNLRDSCIPVRSRCICLDAQLSLRAMYPSSEPLSISLAGVVSHWCVFSALVSRARFKAEAYRMLQAN